MTASGPTLHLHIGLPKTATTFLQTGVFPQLDDMLYVPPPRVGPLAAGDGEDDSWLMHFCLRRSSRIWSDMAGPLFAQMLGERAGDVAGAGRDVLVSDERIGRAGSRPAALGGHLRAMREAAERHGFGRVTCLCAFRRQDAWYASHYAQVSDRNPLAGQGDFEAAVDGMLDPAQGRYRLGGLLDYDALHDELLAALGPGNVLMLPYEALTEDAGAFLAELAGFLGRPAPGRPADTDGADRNARRAERGTWRLRPLGPQASGGPGAAGLAGRVLGAGRRLAGPRERGAVELTPELSARLLAAYGAGNRRLAASLDRDLGFYGYY